MKDCTLLQGKAHICSLVFHNVWLTNDILLGIVGFSSLGVFGDEGLVLDRINKIKMTAVVVEWMAWQKANSKCCCLER